MSVVLGSGEHRYRVVENWAKLPDGWEFMDVAAVAVDSKDQVYVFNRGEHPMIVFDRQGNFLRSWGEGVFKRAHGLHIDAHDNLYCTDDGDHTVRRCSTAGKIDLTIGVPGKPAPFMSGEPFHRCTHTALSPKGDIYVSDGYGNARVHKFSPAGKLIMSWGELGSEPGQFNIAHNIATDDDGWVYVADRENHRVQVFDGNGKYETQWNNLHRPCGLYCCRGRTPTFVIGELGPGMRVNLRAPNLGPRLSIVDAKGKLVARLGGKDGPGLEPGKFLAPHGLALELEGRHLRRRGRLHQLDHELSRHADEAAAALAAEAGEGRIISVRRTKKERLDGGARRPDWRAQVPRGRGTRRLTIGREDRWSHDPSNAPALSMFRREQRQCARFGLATAATKLLHAGLQHGETNSPHWCHLDELP